MDRRNKIYFDYGVNVPTVIAFVAMLGAFSGWLLRQEGRLTSNEGDIKSVKLLFETADKGIIEHARAVEQIAIRDRMEMREDLKEIKAQLNKLVARR